MPLLDQEDLSRKLTALLRSRQDLTEDQRQAALDRFLAGEPLDLPPIEAEPEPERRSPFALGPPLASTQLNETFTEALKEKLPALADVGEAAEAGQVIFPALAVGMAEANKAQQPLSPEEVDERTRELFKFGGFAATERPRTEEEFKAAGEQTERLLGVVTPAFQEMGLRLIGGLGKTGARLTQQLAPAGVSDEFVESARQRFESFVTGKREESDRLARSLGLLGPSDVSERAGAEAVFPTDEGQTENVIPQEVLTEVFKLTDPDLIGGLGVLALKGGLFAAGIAAGSVRAGAFLRRRAKFRKFVNNTTDEFAKQVERSAVNDLEPSQIGAFVDAIEDTRFVRDEGNPDFLAAFINSYGLERTRIAFNLPADEVKTIAAALGDRKPSDFGRRLDRLTRSQEKPREELVSLLSTNDVQTELLLLGNRQKAVTIFAKPLTQAERTVARKLGLKNFEFNADDLPKGFNRLRGLYNPDLVEAIHQGLKQSDNPLTRSAAGFGDTADRFVRTLARKNPRQLIHLSAGGLQSDLAGAVRVELRVGGKTVSENLVNGVDAVSQADLMLRKYKEGVGIRPELPARAGAGGNPAILFHGQKIEDLTRSAGISEDVLRRIETDFNELGLQPLESAALTGALTGTADPFARASILQEAARTMRAARPRRYPTVDAAAQALDDTLRSIDADLPPNAKFFRFVDDGPVGPDGVPGAGPLGPEGPQDLGGLPAGQRVGGRVVGWHGSPVGNIKSFRTAVDDQGLYGPGVYVTDDPIVAANYARGGSPGTFAIMQNDAKLLPLYERERLSLVNRINDVNMQKASKTVDEARDRIRVVDALRRKLAAVNGEIERLNKRLKVLGVTGEPRQTLYGVAGVARNPLDLDAPATGAKRAEFLSRTNSTEASIAQTKESAFSTFDEDVSTWGGLIRAVAHENQAAGLNQWTDVYRALEDMGHDSLTHVGGVKSGSSRKHVVHVFLNSEATEIGRELVVGQMKQGKAYWDPMRLQVVDVNPGTEIPVYAVRDPDGLGKPVTVQGERLDTLSREEATNLVRHGHKHPPVPTETRAGTVQRKLLVGDAPPSPDEIARARATADEIVQLEDAASAKGAELQQVQGRREIISRKLEDLDKRQWEALRNKDDAALDAIHAEMEPFRREMAELAARAQKVDDELETAFGRLDERVARHAQESGQDPSSLLPARNSTPPEIESYMRGRDAYVAAARRLEGKTEAQALAELEDAAKPGLGTAVDPSSPIGPNNPRINEAAWGGFPMDSDNLLRRDHEVTWTARGRILSGILRSPVTGIPRSLGAHQLAASTEINIQNMMAFMDRTQNSGALRRRVLKNEADRNLVGRLVEGDANAIPREWLDEVLDNKTANANAINEYMSMYREATRRLAEHADVPMFRRMREWFGHRTDSSTIRQDLARRAVEARKAGDTELVRKIENEIETWSNNEIEFLNAMDSDNISKKAFYGPLNERMDKLHEYVKDTEDMLRSAEVQAARYRMLRDTLPEWDKTIKKAGGLNEAGKANRPEFRAVVDRLVEGKRQLWQPPDKFTDGLRRGIANAMKTALGQKAFSKFDVDPQFFQRMAGFMRKAGFMMHIGGRSMTALVNLVTLPTHTMLRMAPGDVGIGTAEFMKDMALTGDMGRGLPGLKGLFPAETRTIGGGVGPLHSLYKDATAGFNTHYWDVATHHTNERLLRTMARGAKEGAFDVLSLYFRSTEAFVRGGAFYSEARRATKALEAFRKTGKLKDDFLDGWIAPSKKDLKDNLKLMRERLPELRRKAANYQEALARGEAPTLEPQSLDPQQLNRLEQILQTDASELEKAKAFFDPERGIREALSSDNPGKWIKERGIAAMDETQFTYNRIDRPRFIANYAPWLEVATQFLDFTRKELEFFFQRLPAKGQVLFVSMLYAIGGPRAVPMVEWINDNIVGTAGPDAWAGALDEWEKTGGFFAGAGPAMDVDVAGRLKFNLPLPALKKGKRGQSSLARAAAVLGGPVASPPAEIADSLVAVGSDVSALAQEGQPITPTGQHPGVARIQTAGPRGELRQVVPLDKLGPGGLYGEVIGAAAPALNLPAQGLKSMAKVFEELGGRGIASYLGVAGESLAFQPSPSRPGYLEMPGDRILSVAAWLRDMVRGARAAEEGATISRGRIQTPLRSKIGRWMVQTLGATPTSSILQRRAIKRISEAADIPKRTRNNAIDYTIEHFTPEGRRATPKEIIEHMRSIGWYDVTEEQVRNQIFGRKNPLSGRVAASFDKEQKAYVYIRERLRETLIEDIQNARAMGNEEVARGAMTELVKTRRAFYEKETNKALQSGKGFPRELQAMMIEDLNEYPDPQLQQLSIQWLLGYFQNLAGKWTPDTEMIVLRGFAMNGEQEALRDYVEAVSHGDPLKRDDLFRIGMYLMELNQQGAETRVAGAAGP